MSPFATDHLVFTPDDVDLARSPLAGQLQAETFILGAFNPGLTRLPNGNLLLMVRVAEALREPIQDGHIRSIRWADGRFVLDDWSLDAVDTSDPRAFAIRQHRWRTIGLTSVSWLLPVELSPDGTSVVAVHYDRAIAPRADHQCYGIEDPRISRVGGRYYMTTCTVSPERQATTLYTSTDGLTWEDQGLVLDHQNKDMLIFEGIIGDQFWALTRPLGDGYLAARRIARQRAHGRRRAADSDRRRLVGAVARRRADRPGGCLSDLLGDPRHPGSLPDPPSQRS